MNIDYPSSVDVKRTLCKIFDNHLFSTNCFQTCIVKRNRRYLNNELNILYYLFDQIRILDDHNIILLYFKKYN